MTSLRRRVARLADRRYESARILGRRRARRTLRGRPDPILVYQMGKVGSSAVAAALQRATDRPVVHVHALTPATLAGTEKIYRERWPVPTNVEHLWRGQVLAARLRSDPARRWDVVTLVRDPVARNVSEYFQGDWMGWLDHDETIANLDDPELVPQLVRGFLDGYDRHEVPSSWFDRHIGPAFGLDVFEHPFPHDAGWQLLETRRVRLLILRHEDLASAAGEALGTFLGGPPVDLAVKNVSAGKTYGPAYHRFLDEAALPSDYLSRVYDTGFGRHFYSQAERRAFAERWGR